MASDDAYDVFVSYARSDEVVAGELNGWLCAQGFSTFFDRNALHPGLRWVPALEEAIGLSKAVAILVGKHGIGNTQQYERELALIRQTQDAAFPVIPVLMPGYDSPPTGFLKLLTWVDLSKGAGVLQQIERLADLRAALLGEAVAASPVRASICPYRGLEPFREEDAAFFRGRDDAIRELVTRVQEHAFVAVVGPSGSGKSSLVFAGLLPALRKQSRTTTWDVVTLRPGKSPLIALAEAFGAAPENAGAFENDAWLEKEAGFLRASDAVKLARIVDRRLDQAPEKPERLLMYVDQWEELYAMAPAAEDKARLAQYSADVERFIELLVAATSGARSRATVVLTVRADFYNPLTRNPLLAALLPKQQVNIPPMSRDDLRAAIETPAKTAGLNFAPPELVDRILDDVGLEEGRLPLLQFALKETWGKREGDSLTAKAYTEVGGVPGAIEKTAQDAYDLLKPEQKEAARRLFLSLVTPGEGQADTRARGLFPDDPQQREIINLFANPRTRLLVTGYEAQQGAAQAGREPRSTVEVAHEALIQRWPTLRTWVAANRQKLRDRTAILRAKAEWEENGEDERFLLDPGVQLERGREFLDAPGDVRVDDIRDYVERSIEKDERRLAAERKADLADQKRIADAERQAREAAERAAAAGERTTRVALGGLAAAILVAVVAIWQYFVADQAKKEALTQREAAVESKKTADQAKKDALDQRDRAVQAERAAKSNLLEAQIGQSRFLANLASQTRKTGDAGSAALLALEALPDSDGVDRPYVPEALLQLDVAWHKLFERLVLGDDGELLTAQFSPDGQRIVTASNDGTTRIWATATGKPIGEPVKGPNDWLTSAAFSPDGQRIVTASSGLTARVWDATTGEPIAKLKGHDGAVNSAAFSPDGTRIVTASQDKTARVWDARTGEPIAKLTGHDGVVNSAAFSPDGTHIVTASQDKTARVWDARTGEPIAKLTGHDGVVNSAAFSPDGTHIVTASQDKTARVWNALTGQPIGEPIKGHDSAVSSAAFSPDGTRIVTASQDKTARVWDAQTRLPVGDPLGGHLDWVTSAAFSPDSSQIVSASRDRTARVWDASVGKHLGTLLSGHEESVRSAAFNHDGTRVVTASWDHTARVWDATTGALIRALKGHDSAVSSASFSPDGTRVVTASWDRTARVWNVQTGLLIASLPGHGDWVTSASFSPDGTRVVTASNDGMARVWDATTGALIRALKGHDSAMSSASFSPDGTRVVTASNDGTARVWDATTGALIRALKGHDSLSSASFSPDGKRIVTASRDWTARIWDVASGQPIGEPLTGHDGPVNSAMFSPDGQRIVTASGDKTARVWDVESGKPIGELLEGRESPVNSAAFSPDGRRVVTASSDRTSRIWDVFLDTQALVSAAKAAIPRCLKIEQRKAFSLPPEPPAWCLKMEKWPHDKNGSARSAMPAPPQLPGLQ